MTDPNVPRPAEGRPATSVTGVIDKYFVQGFIGRFPRSGRVALFLVLAAIAVTAFLWFTGSARFRSRPRVFAAYFTPITEPWPNAIHSALDRAARNGDINYDFEDDLGARIVSRVREAAEEGYDVIMGDAFSAENDLRNVARNYAETPFIFGSGLGPTNPNFSVFDDWIHEPAYLAGMIAASMSRTGILGVVAAKPIEEVNRLVNGFELGARAVNEHVRVKVRYTGDWFMERRAGDSAASSRVTVSST